MVKWKIALDTVSNINNFVAITTKYEDDLFVENEDKTFRVNAKSLMGLLYTTEWGGDVYLTAEKEPAGLYQELNEFID